MKDGLAEPAVERLSANLARVHRSFNQPAFIADSLRGLGSLELKQRVTHIIAALKRHLPPNFTQASTVLRAAARDWDGGAPGDPLRGFAAWPMIDYVGVHGLNERELALETLRCLTGLFTAEFAIRPFLAADPQATLATIATWSTDTDPAVRRLCSEGLRPLLPWGKRVEYLLHNPTAIIDVLDRLVYDESLDVRRSVANNLNDISKHHPELVTDTCRRWLKQASRALFPETDRLVRHATRGLVKAGNAEALALHGAPAATAVELVRFSVSPKKVALGESVKLAAELRSTAEQSQRLVVDFAIHYQRLNRVTRPKVFKWKVLALDGRQKAVLEKALSIRPITTRSYYPGKHIVDLLVNGKCIASAEFLLRLPS